MLVAAMFVLPALHPQKSAFITSVSAFAQDPWKKEFEEICSKTDEAMALTADELKALIARCDAVKPSIEKLDEAQRKVYLKRLQMCRDLYAFVLDSKGRK